jgi:hypothetical protein
MIAAGPKGQLDEDWAEEGSRRVRLFPPLCVKRGGAKSEILWRMRAYFVGATEPVQLPPFPIMYRRSMMCLGRRAAKAYEADYPDEPFGQSGSRP